MVEKIELREEAHLFSSNLFREPLEGIELEGFLSNEKNVKALILTQLFNGRLSPLSLIITKFFFSGLC